MYEKRKGSIRLYIAVLLTGLCIFSCTQGHTPDDRIPVPVNDTGINVEISFDPNGGFWDTPEQTAVKKIIGNTGSRLVFTATPQRNDGMVFSGWNTEGGTVSAFPARKAVYKAHWRKLKQNEAFYTVEHHQENLDNNDYTVKETEKQYGIIGTALQVSPKSYKGFNYHKDASTIPSAIAADDSTKAILKYVRKQVTLTFNLDGGTTVTPLTGGNSLTGKCGALLTVAEPSQSGKVFNGWNTVGGKLPTTFPDANQAYTALWRDEGTPPPPSEPAQNLMQNADFSQTESASGPFAGYWSNSTSPKEWKTWVQDNNASIPNVSFKIENGVFSVSAGSTALPSAIGVHQTVTLPDTAQGTQYTLTVKMKITTSTDPKGAGGGRIRLVHKSVCTKYSGEGVYTIPFTVEADGKISFKDDKENTVSADLLGASKNQVKIELFTPGLKHGTVSFSDISLTKGTVSGPSAPGTAAYTVEHHQENANDNGFTLKETETKSGTVGSAPDASPKTYPGLDHNAGASTIPSAIAADGLTKVILKYTRKEVTLTFNLDGGSSTSLTGENTLTGKYGAVLTVDQPTQSGKVFKGWNSIGGTLPATFPLDNQTYTAQWETAAPGTAAYTVEHHQENANDNGFTLKETETKSGTAGSAPDANPKTYPGFDHNAGAPAIPPAIAADGSTKVILKYTRKQVTLTFNLDGGTTTTPLTGGNTLTGKYGAVLTVDQPTQSGKVFKGWNSIDGTLPATFPPDDTEYTAQWEKENLVQNSDFSVLKSEEGKFKAYWGAVNPQSPASWNTIAKLETPPSDVMFTAAEGKFSITAKNTALNMGKIQQPIALEYLTPGAAYTLTATMEMTKNPQATAFGGSGIVKFYNTELLKKTSPGKHTLVCKITVESATSLKLEITVNSTENKTVTINLSSLNNNQKIIELMGYNVKGYILSFSNISLTKE